MTISGLLFAASALGLPPDMLDELVANGTLIEVVRDGEESKEQSNSRRSP